MFNTIVKVFMKRQTLGTDWFSSFGLNGKLNGWHKISQFRNIKYPTGQIPPKTPNLSFNPGEHPVGRIRHLILLLILYPL